MKLTRLRLHGFKSFVEPTDFHIEPGLTGVVGPNGCGKSNLVEALRWVMGETSHKSLRATDMDSVIFSGSGNRPARNHAEVAMSIDNAERTAPAAFNEEEQLEISRRIEREAGSAYRINGKEVRARDVQILFADAATGARSPALVHQGRIGEIIQAKPEQRRRVLEDAAGVAGLHARRHEAELRLKAAETNLTRAEDVIGQLASQMDGLKRQARQAIRYREVQAKVRKAEAMLFHLRWLAAHADVAEAGQTHDLAVREHAERVQHQAEAARLQAIRAAGLPGLREAEAVAAAGLQRLTNARDMLDREEARARERMGELDRRLSQFSADVEREQRLSSDADVALTRLAAEEETLKDDIRNRVDLRSGADERTAAAEAVLADAERVFSELTTALAALTAQRGQLEANVRNHRGRVEKLDREIANVEGELSRLNIAAGQFGDLDELAAAMTNAQQALADAETAEAAKIGDFYEEYLAVLDLTAEFYLETIDKVFQRALLARGELTHHGRPVRPEAIQRTALLTVEGERDDICAVGQTAAAHLLCSSLRPHLKRHHLQPGVGHYGVFSGSKWERQVYPQVRNMVLAMS